MMQFGFCYIPDYHEEVHGSYARWYARLLDEWRLADRLGYDAIWIAEHRYPGYAFCSTPVVAQAIADATSRIRIGTAVALLAQRHPVLSAEHWAAVDLLSGGRLNFGIGRGIFPYDFEKVNVPSSESRERFEEAWEVIRRLWTEETVSHHGRFWSFDDHSLRPQPLQLPTPPVYVAGVASPESYAWAGKNGYHMMLSPFLLDSTDRQRAYLDIYRQELANAGHNPADFEVLGNYHLSIVERPEAVGDADRYFYRYLGFLAETRGQGGAKLDSEQYSHYRPGEGMFQDVQDMRQNRAVIGTPDQCIERIGQLAEACGLTGWMFHINYGGVPPERVVEQMHLFASEVVPVFNPQPALVS